MRRNERREADRVPVGIYLNQVVGSELHRCFTSDISPTGLYMERVCTPLARTSNVVQLELALPGIGDSLWAKAEIVYDCFDALFHGSAVRFTAMAGAHRRLLEAWLHEIARTVPVEASLRGILATVSGHGAADPGGPALFRPPPSPIAV